MRVLSISPDTISEVEVLDWDVWEGSESHGLTPVLARVLARVWVELLWFQVELLWFRVLSFSPSFHRTTALPRAFSRRVDTFLVLAISG